MDLLPTVDKVIYAFEQVKAATSIHSTDEGQDEGSSLGVKKF